MKNDDNFALAVSNLASAAMNADPSLSMAAAVDQATRALRRTTIGPKQIKDSIQPDKIMCFEDGTWHIMLRRYIMRKYNLTPKQYKEKWGLDDNYPFVAPNYSKARSKIAKKSKLGRK